MSLSMRWLVAPDSFKGSLDAAAVAAAMASGLAQPGAIGGIRQYPLADGGEGTMEIVARALSMDMELVVVSGPQARPLTAKVAWGCGDPWVRFGFDARDTVAVLEVAACAGLTQVPLSERNPLDTTSYGLGELLVHVAERGATAVVVGLGGSATVDGGLGTLQAIGARLSTPRTPAVGRDLLDGPTLELSRLNARVSQLKLLLASDVNNPLLGTRGAVRAFGPQKGLRASDTDVLESAIAEYSRRLFAVAPGTVDYVTAVERPGTGAAGGLGYALSVALGAEIRSGIELVMDVLRLDQALDGVDAVLTGEGCLDESSFEGKVVSGVIERARRHKKPVYVVAGDSTLAVVDWRRHGISHVHTLRQFARDREDAMANAAHYIEVATRELAANGGRLDR
jgi:glycerate kinase